MPHFQESMARADICEIFQRKTMKPQDNLSLLHEGDALEHDGFDSEARPESEQDSHI